ncbi:IS3 family transposase [Paenibacillus assamensis]
MNYRSLQHLTLELYDYVNWYNKHRTYGTLDYMSPVDYKRQALIKAV